MEFQVLSDPNGLVTIKYKLLFDVSRGVREVMDGFGIDLAEYNNTSKWVLTIPATFMIDESAIIRSSYVNPNLIQRQSAEEIAYMAGFSDNRGGRTHVQGCIPCSCDRLRLP